MNIHAPVGYQNVYHRGSYKVLCKSSLEESKKDLVFVIEKYSECSNLKVIISDEKDPCFLCVLVVTRSDYDELKKQQGLLIDFDSFPAQLVRLLQQSVSGNMFLLLQQHSTMNLYLEVIEHNEFKRLVHLSLKTGPASDADIKRNMAENIIALKKHVSELSSQLINKENLLQEKEEVLESRIKELNAALCRIKEEKLEKECEHQEELKKERDKLESERIEWKKCSELCTQTQINSLQEALVRKDKQIEDTAQRCRQLQETLKSLESQVMDKGQRILSLEKQLHTVRTDAETWRNQNGALDREYHDKELNLQQTRARLMDVEKTLKDKSDLLRDALDSLQSINREKMTLEEKLSTLEVLSSKYQAEAQGVGEQLLKANQIISKLNTDILEMREKLMCRTAIALEQEKVIDKNSVEISLFHKREKDYVEEIDKLKEQIEKLNEELQSRKRMANEKEEIIKNNHSVIQWLHKKLDALQVSHNATTAPDSRGLHSSTPFLSSHTERNFTENNNDIVNAYSAGLNRKNSAEIPSDRYSAAFNDSDSGEERETRNDKQHYGLDPIYLKPSGQTSRTTSRSKSQESKLSSAKDDRNSKLGSTQVNANKTQAKIIPGKKPPSYSKHNAGSPMSAYFSRP